MLSRRVTHIALIIVSMVYSGCAIINSSYFSANYDLGSSRTASVGEAMAAYIEIFKSDVYGNIKDALRKEVKLVSIDNNVLTIRYRAFGTLSGKVNVNINEQSLHNLTQSRVIQHREFMIEVHEVNAASLRYTVLSAPKANGSIANPSLFDNKDLTDWWRSVCSRD